jgi:integrase
MSRRGAGEGSIYEESPGKWVASITAGYEFKNGKRVRIRKKFSASTRGAVKQKLTDALKLQQDGYSIAPHNQTVGQFLNYWLDHVVPTSTKPKTATFYRYITTTHLIPSIRQIRIQKLSAQHVQALINEKLVCLKQPRKRKGVDSVSPAGEGLVAPGMISKRSVRHIHRTLCTALEVAVKHEAVQRNVAMLIDPPRVPKAQGKFLTLD